MAEKFRRPAGRSIDLRIGAVPIKKEGWDVDDEYLKRALIAPEQGPRIPRSADGQIACRVWQGACQSLWQKI